MLLSRIASETFLRRLSASQTRTTTRSTAPDRFQTGQKSRSETSGTGVKVSQDRQSTPSSTPMKPEPESHPAGKPPFTNDEEYQAWLAEDPDRALALVAVTAKIFAEKRPGMTEAEVAEAEASEWQLKHEMAGFIIGKRFPPMVHRFGTLCAQDSISEEEVQELRSFLPKLDELVDLALTMKEPDRKKIIGILTECRDGLRVVLDGPRD